MADANQPFGSHAPTDLPTQTGEQLAADLSVPDADTPLGKLRPGWERLAGPLLRSLIAVLVGSLLLRLAGQAMGQMTQSYLDRISSRYHHISHTTRGYVMASFFITELIGSLVFGAMSDRYGRRVFMMLGPVFGLVAVQLTSMTSILWLLVLARLIAGLSTGSSVPSTLGYISDVTVGRPNLRARVMGMFEITLVGGIAMGAVAGGYLWTYFKGEQTIAGIELLSPAFSIDGLIYLICLAVFAWGLRDQQPAPNGGSVLSHAAAMRRKFKHYAAVLRAPAVLTFSPAWLSIFSIIGVWTNHAYGLFTGESHFQGQLLTGSMAPEKFGIGLATLAIFFALGILAWSFVLGRYRKTSVMLISTLTLFALVMTVFGLNHLESYSSPFYYSLLGALLIEVLILSGFTPAALTYLADVTESYAADRGSIMGLYSVFLGIGQLIGTSLGGYFADWNGVDGLLFLTAILGLITAVSLLALRRREVWKASKYPK